MNITMTIRAKRKITSLAVGEVHMVESGFTLVELLVVIVIIGILTAIAIPSFLNQTAKAKQSEAKQNISNVIKGQQLWYSEKSSFAESFDDLALGNALRGSSTANTRNYDYGLTTSAGVNTKLMSVTGSSTDINLRSYSGALAIDKTNSQESVWRNIICATLVPGPAVVPLTDPTCPAGFRQLTPNDPS
jgi:type IV pilus assembly protein PilA